MSNPSRRTAVVVTVLVVSGLTGVALCLFKGDEAGLRDWLGNASAPYAIVPFLAGLLTKRLWSAAALGVAATEAMLGGFYWAWAALLHHDGSTFALLLWGTAGLLSGAAFGIAGRIAVTRPAMRYLIPSLLLLEPVAVQLAALSGLWGSPDVPPASFEAWASEIALGIGVLVLVRRSTSRTSSHGRTVSIPPRRS